MKKAFLFILSASLIVAALASCGTKPPKEEPTEPLAQTAQTDTPAASTPAPKPKQKTTPVPKETPKPETEPAPEPEPEETPEETQPAETSLFAEVNETVYVVDTNSVNLRSGPGTKYDKVGSLARGNSATRTGIGIAGTEAEDWSRVALADGTTAHVSSKYLSTSKPTAPSSKQSTAPKQEAPAESGNSGGGGSGGSGVGGGSINNSGGSGGLSAEDQAAIDAIIAAQGGQVIGRQATEEEVRNGGTHGSDFIYN